MWITEPLVLLLVWLVICALGSFTIGYTLAAGRKRVRARVRRS